MEMIGGAVDEHGGRSWSARLRKQHQAAPYEPAVSAGILEILPTAKTDDMPPAVAARVPARANRTAARGAIEVLALIEPLRGIMPVRTKGIIAVATGNEGVSGGSECHRIQKTSRNRGLC